MGQGLWSIIESMGADEFVRRMEELSSSERKDVFRHLDVPAGGASVSARRRNERRMRLAWERLQESADGEACEAFARAWLARHGMAMIIDFLDAVGVEHQDGYLREEDALAGLPPGRVSEVLAGLAARYDARDVRLYAALMDLPGAAVAGA